MMLQCCETNAMPYHRRYAIVYTGHDKNNLLLYIQEQPSYIEKNRRLWGRTNHSYSCTKGKCIQRKKQNETLLTRATFQLWIANWNANVPGTKQRTRYERAQNWPTEQENIVGTCWGFALQQMRACCIGDIQQVVIVWLPRGLFCITGFDLLQCCFCNGV